MTWTLAAELYFTAWLFLRANDNCFRIIYLT